MVNLYDTTFVIPIWIDCVDRERNVKVLVNWVLRETNAFIIILEADVASQLYFAERDTCVKHLFMMMK